MDTFFSKFSDFIIEIMSGMVSRGELTWIQVLFICVSAILFFVPLFNLKSIYLFLKEIRGEKISEYNKMLGYELYDSDKEFIKTEMSRLIRFRLSGIDNVEQQNIIFNLLKNNKNTISPDLFRKFKSYLNTDKHLLIFKKNFSFKAEWIFNRLACLVYFGFAIFLIISSYIKSDLGAWIHIALFIMAVIFVLIGIWFASLVPSVPEIRQLENILKKQVKHNKLKSKK